MKKIILIIFTFASLASCKKHDTQPQTKPQTAAEIISGTYTGQAIIYGINYREDVKFQVIAISEDRIQVKPAKMGYLVLEHESIITDKYEDSYTLKPQTKDVLDFGIEFIDGSRSVAFYNKKNKSLDINLKIIFSSDNSMMNYKLIGTKQ